MKSPTLTGLLLMAYGSPECLDDLEPYLLDIRGGRPTPPALVQEIRHRYAQIGGRSPLLDLTKAQAYALQSEMNRRFAGRGRTFWAYTGMRHWEPRIHAAVSQMQQDGIQQAVALVMAPHSSRMSTGAYFDRLDQALAQTQASFPVTRIHNWHNHPGLIAAIAYNARLALQAFGDARPRLIFTAHSLPQRILQEGDPYDAQLNETAELVARQLQLPASRWRFCYQSAGQSQETWLGPPVEQVVVEEAAAGEKNLLVVPVGFVCDHVEVLYDIDIAARELARQHGARLERSPSLNDSPILINALADLICTSTAWE